MSLRRHKALILEDHAPTAALIAAFVASLGHEYRIVTTLAEFLEAIAAESYCYALVDKQVPAVSGDPALTSSGDTAMRELRNLDPRRSAADCHVTPAPSTGRASANTGRSWWRSPTEQPRSGCRGTRSHAAVAGHLRNRHRHPHAMTNSANCRAAAVGISRAKPRTLAQDLRAPTLKGAGPVNMKLEIEIAREDDGRWIADVPSLPGVSTYGATREEATAKVEALALRVLADRIEHGELVLHADGVAFVAA